MSNEYAGGNQTNVNGKAFENAKNLAEHFRRMGWATPCADGEDRYDYDNRGLDLFIDGEFAAALRTQHSFIRFLAEHGIDYRTYWSKKYLPDDTFIDIEHGVARIFEKKYQKSAGSADEKIQTGPFKLKRFKTILEPLGITDVKYAYILADKFHEPCYDDVRDYYADNDEIDLFYEFPDADYFGL